MSILNLNSKTIEKLDKYNNECNKLVGYPTNDVKHFIDNLNKNGYAVLGYRESCGYTDTTMKLFCICLKAIKELKRQGYNFIEENVKQNNSWATLSGGFWKEIKYIIEKKAV